MLLYIKLPVITVKDPSAIEITLVPLHVNPDHGGEQGLIATPEVVQFHMLYPLTDCILVAATIPHKPMSWEEGHVGGICLFAKDVKQPGPQVTAGFVPEVVMSNRVSLVAWHSVFGIVPRLNKIILIGKLNSSTYQTIYSHTNTTHQDCSNSPK